MSLNVTGFGSTLYITASETFPIGFPITQFPKDVDPLEVSVQPITEVEMGVNGDMMTWASANPIEVKISVIPDDTDDLNLSILHNANRVSRGKTSAGDVITLVVVLPSGKISRYTNGVITDGPPAGSVSSAGRIKTKTYTFMFEDKGGL